MSKEEYKPVIKISDKNVKAHYYYDGSGEFSILHRGNEFLYREDAKLKDHIDYIEDAMKRWKQHLAACKKALSLLKKAKKKAKL